MKQRAEAHTPALLTGRLFDASKPDAPRRGWVVFAIMAALMHLGMFVLLGDLLSFRVTIAHILLCCLICTVFGFFASLRERGLLFPSFIAVCSIVLSTFSVIARRELFCVLEAYMLKLVLAADGLFGLGLDGLAMPDVGLGNTAVTLIICLSGFFINLILLKEHGHAIMFSCSMLTATLCIQVDSFSQIGLVFVFASVIARFALTLGRQSFEHALRERIAVVCCSAVLAVMMLATAVSLPFVNPLDYTLDRTVLSLRREMGDRLHHATGLEIFASERTGYAFTEGRLEQVGDRTVLDRPELSLITDNYRGLYIKCYTGEVYTGIAWEAFDSSTYDGLFSSPVFDGVLLPMLWLDRYEQLVSDGGMERRNITITDLQGSDYCYMPYCIAAAVDGDGKSIAIVNGCDGVRNDSPVFEYSHYVFSSRYSYSYFDSRFSVSDSPYAEAIEAYTDFVYDNYLAVPPSCGRIVEDFSRYARLSLDEKLSLVREHLSENATYSLDIETVPDGADFAEHFLYESKTGYCMHYAISAALMLRAMGVPTRYAEGYIAPSSLIMDVENEEIVLTDGERHAWVEVYYENLGWLPVEFTVVYRPNIGITPTPAPALTPTPTAVPYPIASGGIIPPKPSDVIILAPTPEASPMPSAIPVTDVTSANMTESPRAANGDDRKPVYRLLAGGAGAIILLVLAAAAAMLTIRRRRMRRFSYGSRDAVLNIYSHIIRLLSCDGVECDQRTTPHELCTLMSNGRYASAAPRLDAACGCIYARRFGGSDPTKAEVDQLCSVMCDIEDIWLSHRCAPLRFAARLCGMGSGGP